MMRQASHVFLLSATILMCPATTMAGSGKDSKDVAADRLEIRIRSEQERKREQERRAAVESSVSTEAAPLPDKDDERPWYDPFGIFQE